MNENIDFMQMLHAFLYRFLNKKTKICKVVSLKGKKNRKSCAQNAEKRKTHKREDT